MIDVINTVKQHIRSGFTTYGVGVVDQLLLSGANFVVTLVLARLLSVDEFGVFTMGQVLALYTGVLHVSLIGEPFSVNFSKYTGPDLDDYVRWNNVFHISLSAAVMVVLFGLAVVSGFLTPMVVPHVLICGGLAAMSYFAVWHTRRLCYALRQDGRALIGTTCYIVLMASGLGGLYWLGCLNACTAMGVVAFAGGVLLIPVFRDLSAAPRGSIWRNDGEWGRTHWRYAKWHLGGNAVTGLGQFIAYPVLAVTDGMGASVALRIVETFYAPINQGVTSLGMLVLPRLAVLRETQGMEALRKPLKRMCLVLGVGSIVLMGGLLFAGDSLVVLLFGPEKGKGLGLATALYGGILLLRVVFDMGPALFLRVIQDTRAFFVNGWVVGVVGTILIGTVAAAGGVISVITAKLVVAGISGVVFAVYAGRVMADRKGN